MARMFKKTIVPMRNGSVLVSTVSGPIIGRGRFETMVFPINEFGSPDMLNPLYQIYTPTPKKARRTHRTTCQGFDIEHRPYAFLDGQYCSIDTARSN